MEILREKLFQLESVTINHFPDPGDTEKESFIQHFRNELPKQAMWYINEIMFKDERYVFFTNDKYKTAEAHCTYCGHEYKLHERVKHKTMGVCPNCRNEIEYRNAKISRKKLVFYDKFTFYEKSACDPESIIARSFAVCRDYRKDYKDIITNVQARALYVFTGTRKSYMYKHEYKHFDKYKRIMVGFFKKKTVHPLPNDKANKVFLSRNIKETIKETRFKYIPVHSEEITNLLEYNSMRFMDLLCRYPQQIEMLLKNGFYRLVIELTLKTAGRVVNWRAKKPAGFFGMPASKIKEMTGKNPTVYEIIFFKLGLIADRNTTFEIVKEVAKNVWDIIKTSDKEMFERIPFRKMLKYVCSQEEIYNGDRRRIYRELFDYWRDCKHLELDLKDESILFPRNLMRQHLNITKQIRYKKNKALDIKIKQRMKKLKRFSYTANGLIIRPAISTYEIITEGKILNWHCRQMNEKNLRNKIIYRNYQPESCSG